MEHFSSNCVRRYIDKYQWAVNNCHKDSKKWLCQYRAHTKRKLKKLKPSFVIFCFFLPFYYYLIDRFVIGDSFTFNDSGDTTFNFSISIIALHYTLHLYTDGCWCMIWFGNNITSKYKYSTNIDTTGRQTEPLLATGYATRYKIGSFFEVQFYLSWASFSFCMFNSMLGIIDECEDCLLPKGVGCQWAVSSGQWAVIKFHKSMQNRTGYCTTVHAREHEHISDVLLYAW